jgi:hypothetical protein
MQLRRENKLQFAISNIGSKKKGIKKKEEATVE